MKRRQAYERGLDAEAFVASFLEDEGYVVVARNYTGAGAEIDVIVRRGPVVRFVEVKCRQPGDDSGLESIGPHKQRQLRRGAEAWLMDQVVEEAAFLVALVTVEPDGVFSVEWIDDAF